MRQHYVTILSPGFRVPEQTRKPIEAWDTREAMKLAAAIVERHNARPYAFFFTTMLEHPPVPDGEGGTLSVESREVKRSRQHYINARIRTYDEVLADEGRDSIIASNMRSNGRWFIAESRNSDKTCSFFEADDVAVDADGNITERGDSEERMAYRARKEAEVEAYWKALEAR